MPKAAAAKSAKSADKSADKSATNVSVGVHASPPSQLSNLASVIAVALAVGVFSVYTGTCYPTLPGGDAGELIYNAHRAGVAHPPGYPIFTMLGYIASHSIPFGSVAWRVNMTSVAYSTGAAVFLYLSILCYLRLRDEQSAIASVSVPLCVVHACTPDTRLGAAGAGFYQEEARRREKARRREPARIA